MEAQDIDGVISGLDQIINQSMAAGSALGYFPALYRQVTRRVKERIAEGDYFEDGPRMRQLVVVFANRYLVAFDQYEKGSRPSECWQVSFEAAADSRPIVLQHLLLGMNAHISYDLGVAAADVSPGDAIESLKGDFMKINELLAGEVDAVQAKVAKFAPLMKVLDWLGGQFDESVANFSMDIARDSAWKVATDLARIPSPAGANAYREKRDQSVSAFAARLYQPRWPINWFLRIVRWFERKDVRQRIAILSS